MADDHPSGFLKYARNPIAYRDPEVRTEDYYEVYAKDWDEGQLREQGTRCMDCGVPTCMGGCPIGNIIPAFNDLVSRGNWWGPSPVCMRQTISLSSPGIRARHRASRPVFSPITTIR